MLKNNVLKIVACIILASSMSIFCSQVPQIFTAEDLICHNVSMGQTINLNGQLYKVIEEGSEHSLSVREIKDQEFVSGQTSRKITLYRPTWCHMRAEELTVSGALKTVVNLKNNESKNFDKQPEITSKTYFSTLAKALGATALVGAGVAAFLKCKSQT